MDNGISLKSRAVVVRDAEGSFSYWFVVVTVDRSTSPYTNGILKTSPLRF